MHAWASYLGTRVLRNLSSTAAAWAATLWLSASELPLSLRQTLACNVFSKTGSASICPVLHVCNGAKEMEIKSRQHSCQCGHLTMRAVNVCMSAYS